MIKQQNQIEKLISKLCPKGVEFKELDNIFNLRNGYTPSKSNQAYWNKGIIPWFRMDDIRTNGRILNTSLQHITPDAIKGGKLFPANSIIVATSATIGEHALITVPHLSNQRFTSLSLKDEFLTKLDMKFIYYYCFILDEWCLKNTTISSFASVDMIGFKRFKIPVPPLEIQNEIVRILDTFTELEAVLEAELEARKKQYAYYKSELLSFRNEIPTKSIGDICQINRGRVISKDYLRINAGDYPVYSSQTLDDGVFGRINTYDYDGEYLTWTTDGANAGSVFYRNGKFSITNVCGLLKVRDNSVITRYLLYILSNVSKKYVSAGMGNPKIMSNVMERIIIPVPPIAEQGRIVSILDKFDALVNDISVGLPAELQARRQQYEYYRNKLLTFKEYDG